MCIYVAIYISISLSLSIYNNMLLITHTYLAQRGRHRRIIDQPPPCGIHHERSAWQPREVGLREDVGRGWVVCAVQARGRKSRRGVKEEQVTHTNTPHEQHYKRPHPGPPPSLNSDRRWRGDSAYHLPHPGGWPRPRGEVRTDIRVRSETNIAQPTSAAARFLN